MSRLVIVLLLAFVVGAFAGVRNSRGDHNNNAVSACESLLATRASALNALSTTLTESQYAVATATIQYDNSILSTYTSGGCCSIAAVASNFASKYATPFGSSTVVPNAPVCGYDFQTYATPAAACAVGVYHAGACNFFLDAHGNVEYVQGSTNLYCYSIADIPTRVNCVLGLVNDLVLTNGLTFQPPDYVMAAQVQQCGAPNTINYRQVDGSCNNVGAIPLIFPPSAAPPFSFTNVLPTYSGMVGNKFVHEYPVLPTNPAAYIASGPNPRVISNRLFTQTTKKTPPVAVNALTFAWVNWFVHDFMNHDNSDWQHPYAFPMPANDPYFANTPDNNFLDAIEEEYTGYEFNNLAEYFMLIQSTRPSPDTNFAAFPTRRNAATAWFDGSQVYGNDINTQNNLRTFTGGLLKVNSACNHPPCLPDGPASLYVNGNFLTGDYRTTFHPGVTAIHTLWVREHNNIATLLAKSHPTFSDEQLFQTARLIVNAEMIKIHTLEWTNQMAPDYADAAVTSGLAAFFLTGNATAFEAFYNFVTHIVPEEFVAVYKWHSYTPPSINLVSSVDGSSLVPNVDYVAQFQDTTLIRSYGAESLLVSLALSQPGSIRLNNLPPKLQTFTHPYVTPAISNPFGYSTCVIVPMVDMAAIDIIRDRERGIPKYNAFRSFVSAGILPAAQYFDDIADTPAQAAAVADVYQWNIQEVDTYVGLHGEKMNSNQGFPVTMAAAFIPFVVSRMINDRFYNVDYTAQYYTQWGINRLKTVDLAQIFCDNGITCNIPDRTHIFTEAGWNVPGLKTPTITKTVA